METFCRRHRTEKKHFLAFKFFILVCMLITPSPAIAQRTGVNKSVSFARWQQGAGFVVPHTTACFIMIFTVLPSGVIND